MSQWQSQPVALTAGMVSGATPLLAAEANTGTMRRLIAIQSRSAGALELFFGGGAVGAAGQGVPLAAGARLDFDNGMTFNGALWSLGGTAAEFVVFVFA